MKHFFALFILLCIPFIRVQATYNPSPELDKFIHKMVEKHGFDPKNIENLMSQAHYEPTIIKSIKRPYEKQSWEQYEQLFLKPERIKQGAEFLNQHYSTLKKAEKNYGVPASLITAIIGIETDYGHYLGKYRVLDSLYTLSFYHWPRASFFQSELEAFLLLARENKVDLTLFMGSYAGAIGLPQFMPSSYRKYAVDYDHDGKKDLYHSIEDSIGSIAYYFKEKGWHAHETIAVQARIHDKKFLTLPYNLTEPTYTIKTLRDYGIRPIKPLPLEKKVTFLRLTKNEKSEDYWLGLHNFYVITRYNNSINYAMAIYQLSQAIEKTYKKNLSSKTS